MKWKMISLIILGVILALISMTALQRLNILYWDVYLFVAISFYPLAIVYGRKVMVDVFHSIKEGPYSPFSINKKNAVVNLMYRAINLVVAIIAFMLVSWIYGVYNAYQHYQMQKGYIVK